MVVNIIIPVYNTAEFVAKCLDSVFNQTYKDIFVICVNDGSTDESLQILTKYALMHSNMAIINKTNGGLASSRNTGVDFIKNYENSYIVFLDSDDFLKEDFIQMLVENLERTNADIVCSGLFDYQSEEDFKENIKIKEETTFSSYEGVEALFKNKIKSHAPCKIYKGWLWKNFRYDENFKFMEDQCSTFQIFLKASKIVWIPYAGYYYVHRIGSLCQSKMVNSKILCALRSYLFNYKYCFDSFSKKQQKHLKKLILNQFSDIYLMMYPRFNYDTATEEELAEWKNIVEFSKLTHAVYSFKVRSFKTFLKKYTYLVSKKLYLKLFKHFLKEYDN